MDKIIKVNNGIVNLSNKKKKIIKGYYKNNNRIDLDSYINKSKIDIKYRGVIFPMFIRDIELNYDPDRKDSNKYKHCKLVMYISLKL